MQSNRVMLILSTISCFGVMTALGLDSNVARSHKYSWGENIGWVNWRDADGASSGLIVHRKYFTGYAWCGNVGWIDLGHIGPDILANGFHSNVSNQSFGINIDQATGYLSGFAWSENAGWINFTTHETPAFQGARFDDQQGTLSGFAWSENAGWIDLGDTAVFVCALVADLDDSGGVGTNDLVLLLESFGSSVTPYAGADFDGNGTVNTLDLAYLLKTFGVSCDDKL